MDTLLGLSIAILIPLLLSFNAYAYKIPDPIFVGGVQYKIDKTSFLFNQGVHEAKVPLFGDNGQELIFDIDARIEGRGYHDTGIECINIHPRLPGMAVSCDNVKVNPSEKFKFMVEMSVSCSGISIAQNSNDRNAFLGRSEVKHVRENIEALADQGYYPFFPSFYDTKRSVYLLIDEEKVTNGKCTELTIQLKGLQTTIDKILVDVFVVEAF